MLHTKAEDWCTEVIPDLFLLRIEAYALADNGRFRTGGTPDRVRHLKADCEYTLPCLTGAVAESISVNDEQAMAGPGEVPYLPASLFAEVVPSCSGGT